VIYISSVILGIKDSAQQLSQRQTLQSAVFDLPGLIVTVPQFTVVM